MNLRQYKRFHAHKSMGHFFKDNGALLAARVPDIADAIKEYNILFALARPEVGKILEDSKPATAFKDDLKETTRETVWKLVIAMQYHYDKINDLLAANKVDVSYYTFSRMSEETFFSFATMVLNNHEPGLFTRYDIDDDEIAALIETFPDYPNHMQAVEDARLLRKNASKDLDGILDKLRDLLKNRIDKLMRMTRRAQPELYSNYRKLRHIGNVSPIRGVPQHKGTLAKAELKLLKKYVYRRKRKIFIKNKGLSPLMAGIGTSAKSFSGTPFVVPPGKTMQRLCLKLAPAGEFFLVQNMGEENGKYEVWIKE